MQKGSSDKVSKGSTKKAAVVESSATIQKENNVVNETELLLQKDGDDTDPEEEEQSVPALTSSSENLDSPFPPDNETSKVDTAEAAMTKIQGSAHEGTGTSISSQIQKIIARELGTPAKRGKIDLQSVPLKEYLEQTVIPIVHQGLIALARERPVSPIEYLAAYFLKHKHKYLSEHDQPTVYSADPEKSSDNSSGNAPPTTSNIESSQQGPTTEPTAG